LRPYLEKPFSKRAGGMAQDEAQVQAPDCKKKKAQNTSLKREKFLQM
jgi:hypothetical protein